MTARPRILNLSTTPKPRPQVVIDGESYGLRRPEELSLRDHLDAIRRGYGLDALVRVERSPAGDAALAAELTALATLVLDAPADLIARLHEVDRLAIITTYVADPDSLTSELLDVPPLAPQE